MNKILKQLGAILVVSIISTTAIANHMDNPTAANVKMHNSTTTNSTTVNTTVVVDHYKTIVKQIPYDVEVCKQVRQGTGNGSATNEIIGAIFGGAIGNQFGEGDGKDAMTLAGILLGASLAHDDELAQGPGVITTKCYIETRYQESVHKVYSHSTIRFKINGRSYLLKFVK